MSKLERTVVNVLVPQMYRSTEMPPPQRRKIINPDGTLASASDSSKDKSSSDQTESSSAGKNEIETGRHWWEKAIDKAWRQEIGRSASIKAGEAALRGDKGAERPSEPSLVIGNIASVMNQVKHT
jgi:hypothetical protein